MNWNGSYYVEDVSVPERPDLDEPEEGTFDAFDDYADDEPQRDDRDAADHYLEHQKGLREDGIHYDGTPRSGVKKGE